MKLVSILSSTSLVLLLVSGCAHSENAPPPAVSSLGTTSAAMTKAPDTVDPDVAAIRAPTPAEMGNAPKDPGMSIAEQGAARTGLVFKPEVEKRDAPTGSPVDVWSQHYPDAARELGDWMRRNPETANRVGAWSAANPIHVQTLTAWAGAHKVESVDAFLYGRAGWSTFQAIRHDDPEAIDALVDWMRKSPSAAGELVTHADALSWAKDHVAGSARVVAPAAQSKPLSNGTDESPWTTTTLTSVVR